MRLATFESTGHTVFREGDPAIPDIAAEKRGVPPSILRSGRYGTGSAGKTTSTAPRRLRRKGSGVARALRAFLWRGDPLGERRCELDGPLAARLKEEADGRGATEREVLEEAVRLYLAGRRGGGET